MIKGVLTSLQEALAKWFIAKAGKKDVKTPFYHFEIADRAVNERGYLPRSAESLINQAKIKNCIRKAKVRFVFSGGFSRLSAKRQKAASVHGAVRLRIKIKGCFNVLFFSFSL